MSLKVQIIEAGTQVGVKFGNEVSFYERVDIEVFSTDDSLVGLYVKETDEEIVLAPTTDWINPKEASVKDLIEKIKDILITIPVLQLTLEELEAIQGANNPSSSNVFVTFDDITTLGSSSLRNINSTDTFSTPNETLNCTSGTFTVNLPTAVGIQGVVYTLVNSGTGIITLDANGTETINGSETIEIKRQYLSRTVQSDGSNWIII